MFGDLVRQWCRLVFWWVPTDQKHQTEQTHSEPEKRTEPAATQSPPAPTSEPAPEPSRATSSPEDDLTAIKGIGPTMDKHLRAMGIRTFANLAAADATEVARKLNSRPVTAERVGEWITEAKKRV